MAIQLHNTLTRKKEAFEPADPERVTMYVCGPTVYNYAHIGNARPAVVFDVFHGVLKRRYPNVIYARNITDVEDKINKAALEEGVPIDVINARYTKAYHEDMGALGVGPPSLEPRVTEHIPQIIDMIGRLIESGNAYEADGHVLFNVPSFEAYGALSRRNRDEMIAGARVEVAPYKKDPADFVLWKPSDETQPGWDSPWGPDNGRGRPGWHIECSAMAETQLGQTIDIHGGGLDLTFPHHENEIAQSTCAHGGALFARYWMHNGFVNVDAEKMSKSLGNVLLVRDLLKEAPGEAIRLALLTAHYRKPLDWTEEGLQWAKSTLDRWYRALELCGDAEAIPPDEHELGFEEFFDALEDDLNTPQAIGVMHRHVDMAFDMRELTDAVRAKLDIPAMKGRLLRMGEMLGVLQHDPVDWRKGNIEVSPPAGQLTLQTRFPIVEVALAETKIEELIALRNSARQQRDFETADNIRDQLHQEGIELEDGPTGTTWRRTHRQRRTVSADNLSEVFQASQVDVIELEDFLLRYFGNAKLGLDDFSEVYLGGDEGQHQLKLKYDERTRHIIKIEAGPKLENDQINVIRNRIFDELIVDVGKAIGRSVMFSTVPVEGYFRYRDILQILPISKDAPRPGFQIADEPFLLEFAFRSSISEQVRSDRRERTEREIKLLLALLLKFNSRMFAESTRFHWVSRRDESNNRSDSEYIQEGYFWPNMESESDEFSDTGIDSEMSKISPQEYFGLDIRHEGLTLGIAENLADLLDIYFALNTEKRERFSRACYWFQHARRVLQHSHSASFLALVSAVESLVPESDQARCPECGGNIGPGLTQRFTDFLEKHAQSDYISASDRKKFYNTRSKITHGHGLLYFDQFRKFGRLAEGPGSDLDQIGSMEEITKVTLVNWLSAQSTDADDA